MQYKFKVGETVTIMDKDDAYYGIDLKGIIEDIQIVYDVKKNSFWGKRACIEEKYLIKMELNEINEHHDHICNKYKIGEIVIVINPKSKLYQKEVVIKSVQLCYKVNVCGQNKTLNLLQHRICKYSQEEQNKREQYRQTQKSVQNTFNICGGFNFNPRIKWAKTTFRKSKRKCKLGDTVIINSPGSYGGLQLRGKLISLQTYYTVQDCRNPHISSSLLEKDLNGHFIMENIVGDDAYGIYNQEEIIGEDTIRNKYAVDETVTVTNTNSILYAHTVFIKSFYVCADVEIDGQDKILRLSPKNISVIDI